MPRVSEHRLMRSALGLLLGIGATLAQAEVFPSKAVRIIIPAAPGGSADKNARAIADKLSELWKQPVIVDLKPGANTLIGTDYVAKSAPDGYTLLMNSAAIVVNPSVYAKLPYDTLNDLVPVALVSTAPFAVVVHPSVPARSIKEFIALARTNPQLLSFGTAESRAMLAGHQFNLLARTQLQSIPYKGAGPLMNDLVAGHVPVSFSALSSVQAQVQAGRLRLLGVASSQRSSLSPEAEPIAANELPGFEAASWFGLFAPKGTPKSLASKIHQDVAEVLRDPVVAKRFADMGAQPSGEGPEPFALRMRAEVESSAKVARAANIQPE
ncbi:tripartite tricarboxylate transporter substrate binding protein [Variovorax sp. KBS0712]|uniref:Bug family tripartite tricarboxylate transporter substrate binding protein n=1 Tax=Variovorax sp. KBS0712 TaxID=2578111 RepID=UPI0011197BDC|nr:tripartite tricarboxylate transporter substrate binding protein [Variovorax sp. KBS0712]TSD54664.1 tripartite tricarboxylate transporter substrate binding protein [Variovorax sp. KBS0712]